MKLFAQWSSLMTAAISVTVPGVLGDKKAVGIAQSSLVFSVVHTIWYGYAIMYIFEGLGFELTAH